jgi:hypothetical protein
MSARGTDLMNKASGQLAEATGLVDRLTEAELGALCPDESDDGAGHTVGAVAAHLAQGYGRLGQFLQVSGYIPHASGTGAHDHAGREQHGADPAPESVPGLLNRLAAGTASVGLLADLTDQQLDSVPDDRSSRFSDGRRTLAQVLDVAIAHQAEHLAALRRAVG